jgi:hypothetical protein
MRSRVSAMVSWKICLLEAYWHDRLSCSQTVPVAELHKVRISQSKLVAVGALGLALLFMFNGHR